MLILDSQILALNNMLLCKMKYTEHPVKSHTDSTTVGMIDVAEQINQV